MERGAGCELALVFREQQATLGRSIVARESSEFFIEVLEAEAEAEGLRVLQK
jgi:hypothetical protein